MMVFVNQLPLDIYSKLELKHIGKMTEWKVNIKIKVELKVN